VATIKGRIKAISISQQRGTKKYNVPSARIEVGLGIVGDAHSGNWHRQVSLLGIESIKKVIVKHPNIAPGDFAENITTEGLDLPCLGIAAKLKLGETAEIEITQLGKKCHQGCEIFEQVGDCIMPREGIFAKVIRSGRIETGDTVEVLNDQSSDTDNQR